MTETTTLRVALATLGDWEHDFAQLFALESDAPKVERKQPRASAAPYARREKVELEATIRELTRRIYEAKARRPLLEDKVATEYKALQIECRSIIARQRKESERAQAENERLRGEVDSHWSRAVRIERLIRRATALANAFPSTPDVAFDQYQGPSIDPQEHLQELNDLVESAETVFKAKTFQNRHIESYRDIRIEEVDSDFSNGFEVVMEVGWALPFPLDAVADTLWAHTTRMVNANSEVHIMDILVEPTLSVSRFISVPKAANGMPINHGQNASKIVLSEANDDFRLFVSSMHSQRVGGDKWLGHLRSSNWFRVERADGPGSASPLSRIKFTRRVRLKPLQFDQMSRFERVKWVRNTVKGRWYGGTQRNIDHNMQSIENALMGLQIEEHPTEAKGIAK